MRLHYAWGIDIFSEADYTLNLPSNSFAKWNRSWDTPLKLCALGPASLIVHINICTPHESIMNLELESKFNLPSVPRTKSFGRRPPPLTLGLDKLTCTFVVIEISSSLRGNIYRLVSTALSLLVIHVKSTNTVQQRITGSKNVQNWKILWIGFLE